MANERKPKEYRFKIEAYSPETMPLGRLTEYLRDLSEMLGDERANIHLIRIDGGSTVPVLAVEPEAEQKILYRFQEIENRDAPRNVLDAVNRINKKLRMDSAKGAIVNPDGENVIFFPGVERATLEYSLNQIGTLDGIPILVGGKLQQVPVHLEGRRGERYNYCTAEREKAKAIAHHLFTTIIRVEGVGRWVRHAEGDWELASFKINDFTPLAKPSELSLKDSIEELRQIPAKWKELEDPVGDLMRLRDDIEM